IVAAATPSALPRKFRRPLAAGSSNCGDAFMAILLVPNRDGVKVGHEEIDKFVLHQKISLRDIDRCN
ncbi:MAG TPA: hypothetical protein PLD03_02520, partial [Thiomonas arsenitoxydans]|nr:hypothetical protein [Thiomonas arsenitoxydans]